MGKVVYIWVVLAGVGATRLFACGGSGDGLNGVLKNVPEFKRFDQVPVIPLASVTAHGAKARTYEFQIMLRSLIPTLSKLL